MKIVAAAVVVAAFLAMPVVVSAAQAKTSATVAPAAPATSTVPRTFPTAKAPTRTTPAAKAPTVDSTGGPIAVGRSPVTASAKEAPTDMNHPRLFFSPQDMEVIRARCAGSMRPQYDVLVAYADAHLSDAPPALEGDYETKGLQIEDPYLTNILDFSFLYVVNGEAKYGDAARRWAVALASMKGWSGKPSEHDKEVDRGLYEGFGLTGLAAAYDWLYSDFTADERAIIRDRMTHLAEGIYRATSGGEWWSFGYLHHDHWIPVGGMGLAAMALVDEVPDAQKWADKANSEFGEAFNRLGDDGAWHEGVCGWTFGMATFLPFLDAYDKRFGTTNLSQNPLRRPEAEREADGQGALDEAMQRRALSTRSNDARRLRSRPEPGWGSEIDSRLDQRPWLMKTWAFRSYMRMPDGSFIAFGDGRADGHYQWTGWEAGPMLRFLAAKFNNPYAQWFAAREWAKRPNAYTAVWEILWADDRIFEASPVTLPPSALFENDGLAVLRTGWDRLSTVAAFHADSVVGRRGAEYYEKGDENINTGADHPHADANSFALWSRGSLAITPAGYGQGDTEFQNTLLVDDQGQYRSFDRKAHPGRPNGQITRFFPSRFASFVTGQAAECYPKGLKSFERTLYLVDPGIVFIVDNVVAEKPVSLKWLYHVDKAAAVSTLDDGFQSTLAGATTVLRFGRDESVVLATGEDRLNQSILAALTSKKQTARVTAVIVPCAPAADAVVVDKPADGVFFIDALGASLAAVLPAKHGKFEAPGRLSGDGAAAIATLEGTTKGFLAVDATELVVDGDTLLSSPVPVTVSCYCDAAGGTLTVTASEPTQIAVDARTSIKDLTATGGRSVPYITDGPKIILNVYEGTRTYDLLVGEGEAREGN